ncbi:hypothetical protein GCM10007385_26730 [Tateyamaria omphalii]|uniref:DUF4177 domain-containing protein n=1 Tax=Tateyamaria omphalii TaxID=299262 RepID=UPI00167AB0F1|nr:DUF4177 domain-containing protein [Tateyamaria omphalii]GGX56605.1 hypothetical protein GCM10007385_26730 [Tateyamaria omphalii]
MSGWEYKVVPAPTKGVKSKGVKGPEARFAHALESMMNDMGRDGWEFQRAETLPSIERSGLTGSTTEWRNLLVFRRPVSDPIDEFEPELLPPPADTPETDNETPEGEAEDGEEDATFSPGEGATQMASDNGVEETSPVSGMTTSLKNLASQRSGAETKD